MTFKYFQNYAFEVIPKKDRVAKGAVAICRGGCNSLKSINDTSRQLCTNCGNKWRYYGYECDVPNCEAISDGTREFKRRKNENKLLCSNCYDSWRITDYCIWERFVEMRHLFLLRPEPFVKALEEGIITAVEKENMIKSYEIAECHHCYEIKKIDTPKYQLCSTCSGHLRHHGNDCEVCKVNDAHAFDNSESIFVCSQCQAAKSKYKIASYHIYKTQIRTIKNCQICNVPISHDREEGENYCSAFIDHDHDTDITRGVICISCNTIEGFIKTIGITPYTYATRLKSYLKNPPLDQSWTQDRDSFR